MDLTALEPLFLPAGWEGVVAGRSKRIESWAEPCHEPGLPGHWSELMRQAPSLAAVPGLWGSYAEAVREMGFAPDQLVLGEQVHGTHVARVEGRRTSMQPNCDGLICSHSDLVLGVYVADCAPILLWDPQARAIGLLHSGRKGTEGSIVRIAIESMVRDLGARRDRLRCWIGPCISSTHFELDLPALIAADAQLEGLSADAITWSGHCTASRVAEYYSYRREKGSTGRHLFLLALRASPAEGLPLSHRLTSSSPSLA